MNHSFTDITTTELNTAREKMEEVGYSQLTPAISPQKLLQECGDDQLLLKCVDSMFSYCTRYSHDVFSMMLAQKKLEIQRTNGEDTKEEYNELKEIDIRRHQLHEATISSIQLVMREFNKREKENAWMHNIDREGRAGYATFALLTFYKLYSTMN